MGREKGEGQRRRQKKAFGQAETRKKERGVERNGKTNRPAQKKKGNSRVTATSALNGRRGDRLKKKKRTLRGRLKGEEEVQGGERKRT